MKMRKILMMMKMVKTTRKIMTLREMMMKAMKMKTLIVMKMSQKPNEENPELNACSKVTRMMKMRMMTMRRRVQRRMKTIIIQKGISLKVRSDLKALSNALKDHDAMRRRTLMK